MQLPQHCNVGRLTSKQPSSAIPRSVRLRPSRPDSVVANASKKGKEEGLWSCLPQGWVKWVSSTGEGSAKHDASALRLLPPGCAEGQQQASPLTVYSVRLTTSSAAHAALSDPMSGVNVLLVGSDGRSVLHRISPLNDPAESMIQMRSICQVVDATVGANCSLALPASASSPNQPHASAPSPACLSPAAPKLRFQQGHVDEVSFLAPELGPLSALLVGTESGTWLLDEVDVSSSRTAHTDRFVCRVLLGAQPGQGAEWLLPVPPEAFVYGSGENTVILTKEHADSTLRAMNLNQPEVQSRLLVTTLVLAAGGSGVAGMAAGLDGAIPFAIGGMAGMAYEWVDVKQLFRQAWGSGVRAVAEPQDAGHRSAGAHSSAEAGPAQGARREGSSTGASTSSGGSGHSRGRGNASSKSTGSKSSSGNSNGSAAVRNASGSGAAKGAGAHARFASSAEPPSQPVMRPLTRPMARRRGGGAAGRDTSFPKVVAASRVLRRMASSPMLQLGVATGATLVLASSVMHGQAPEPVLSELQAVAQEEVLMLPASWEALGQGVAEAAWKLMLGLLGFGTCKVASVEVLLAPDEPRHSSLASSAMKKQYEKS